MKKANRTYINKRWQKGLGIICFLGLILASVVFLMDSSQEKKKVSAHPTNTIKLDEGGSNEFDLPVDAQQLEEQAIRDLGTFDEYVQGKDIVPIALKSIVTSYGSNNVDGETIGWFVTDIQKTSYGNYLVLFGASGSGKGGLLKVSLFNTQGIEIATRVLGNLSNTTLRISTRFYEVSNNNFLIGTNSDRFYKCTISSETASSASINLSGLSSTGFARQQLKVAYTSTVITNKKIDDKPIITGRIYPEQSIQCGVIKGRIPIGTLDNQNWLSGSLTGIGNYHYSLENIIMSELGFSEQTANNINATLHMDNTTGFIFGQFRYGTANATEARQSFQVFSQEDTVVNGDTLKKRKYSFVESNAENEIETLYEISNDEKVYYLRRTETETQIIEVDLLTFQDRLIRSYPPKTRLLMQANSDGSISYYGSTSKLEGEFYSSYYSSILNSPYYYIQGVMNGMDDQNPAQVRSLRAIEIDDWIAPSHVVKISDNGLLIGGMLTDYQKFADKSLIVAPNGTTNNGIPANQGAFIGKITIADDFSPIIKQGSNITIDTNSLAVVNPTDSGYRDWNTLDRWLITGSKNGLVTDTDAIKVYDHFDSNDSSIASTVAEREEWLQKRINRNPNNISAAIEWDKLGFDKTTAGAQLVTYFVTDTQSQPAVTSRWINKKTGQTEEADDFALDAQNFHIPLNGIETAIPDSNKFKELAKTMAWNKKDIAIDEDGTDSGKLSSKVTVDANQLKSLREAKTAKPYPVDITYKPKLGVEIKNRVWVFVTTKNTVPNSETSPEITLQDTNGVVFYADDYELPYRMRSTHTDNDVLARGNVRVYDYYDSSHETSAELPTLADASKNANNLIVENLDVINNATQPGKITPSIRYEWDGAIDGNHKDGSIAGNETRGSLDVTLTGNILLHVRQVVVQESNELVVPRKGYIEVKNLLFNGGVPSINTDYQIQLEVDSGKLANDPGFTAIGLSVDHLLDGADEVLFSVIIPEFYQYLGYYSTTEQVDPGGDSHQDQTSYSTGNLSLTKSILNNEEEFWITLYLEPNGTNNGKPQPYSWDYKHNDLGKITE